MNSNRQHRRQNRFFRASQTRRPANPGPLGRVRRSPRPPGTPWEGRAGVEFPSLDRSLLPLPLDPPLEA